MSFQRYFADAVSWWGPRMTEHLLHVESEHHDICVHVLGGVGVLGEVIDLWVPQAAGRNTQTLLGRLSDGNLNNKLVAFVSHLVNGILDANAQVLGQLLGLLKDIGHVADSFGDDALNDLFGVALHELAAGAGLHGIALAVSEDVSHCC